MNEITEKLTATELHLALGFGSSKVKFNKDRTLSGNDRFKGWQLTKDGDLILSGPLSAIRLQPFSEGWKGRDERGFAQLVVPFGNIIVKFAVSKKERSTRSIEEEIARNKKYIPESINEKTEVTTSSFSNTVVALVGCDRFEYFQKSLVALKESINFSNRNLPVYIFLDKSPEIEIHAEFAKRTLPKCQVIKRQNSWGCGRNLIDVRRTLFDKCGYENVFIFEDDLVISKSYISLMLNLLTWCKEKYDNVGIIQGWNFSPLKEELKREKLHLIEATFTDLWGYCITRDCWNAIKEKLYDVEEKFLRVPYKERNPYVLRDWLLKQKGNSLEGRLFPLHYDYSEWKDYRLNNPITGQDGATIHITALAGYLRVTTQINRAINIGRKGIHMMPHLFDRCLTHMELNEFDEDRDLRVFYPAQEKIETGSLKYDRVC